MAGRAGYKSVTTSDIENKIYEKPVCGTPQPTDISYLLQNEAKESQAGIYIYRYIYMYILTSNPFPHGCCSSSSIFMKVPWFPST